MYEGSAATQGLNPTCDPLLRVIPHVSLHIPVTLQAVSVKKGPKKSLNKKIPKIHTVPLKQKKLTF